MRPSIKSSFAIAALAAAMALAAFGATTPAQAGMRMGGGGFHGGGFRGGGDSAAAASGMAIAGTPGATDMAMVDMAAATEVWVDIPNTAATMAIAAIHCGC